MRLLVHDVASAKPRQVAIFLLVFLVLNLQEAFFCVFEFSRCCRCDSEIPIEIVVIDEVRTDTLQVDKHIIELLENEKARGHALTTWDSVAFGWRSTDHLEEVLSNAHVVLLVGILTDDSMNDCF